MDAPPPLASSLRVGASPGGRRRAPARHGLGASPVGGRKLKNVDQHFHENIVENILEQY
jgi:hypothetical protein